MIAGFQFFRNKTIKNWKRYLKNFLVLFGCIYIIYPIVFSYSVERKYKGGIQLWDLFIKFTTM